MTATCTTPSPSSPPSSDASVPVHHIVAMRRDEVRRRKRLVAVRREELRLTRLGRSESVIVVAAVKRSSFGGAGSDAAAPLPRPRRWRGRSYGLAHGPWTRRQTLRAGEHPCAKYATSDGAGRVCRKSPGCRPILPVLGGSRQPRLERGEEAGLVGHAEAEGVQARRPVEDGVATCSDVSCRFWSCHLACVSSPSSGMALCSIAYRTTLSRTSSDSLKSLQSSMTCRPSS